VPEPKTSKASDPPAPKSAPPVLGSAASSTDPAVQYLIAERQTAVLNGDKDAAKAIDERLAELGLN
jgi:hypothetical protein